MGGEMNAFCALLFNLLAPGAGQIFLGDFAWGIGIGLFFALGKSVLLPLGLRTCKVKTQRSVLKIFYAVNWCYILLIMGAAAIGFYRGFFVQETHFLYALISVFVIISLYKNTFNNFIFSMLYGRTGVYGWLRVGRKSPTEKPLPDGKKGT